MSPSFAFYGNITTGKRKPFFSNGVKIASWKFLTFFEFQPSSVCRDSKGLNLFLPRMFFLVSSWKSQNLYQVIFTHHPCTRVLCTDVVFLGLVQFSRTRSFWGWYCKRAPPRQILVELFYSVTNARLDAQELRRKPASSLKLYLFQCWSNMGALPQTTQHTPTSMELEEWTSGNYLNSCRSQGGHSKCVMAGERTPLKFWTLGGLLQCSCFPHMRIVTALDWEEMFGMVLRQQNQCLRFWPACVWNFTEATLAWVVESKQRNNSQVGSSLLVFIIRFQLLQSLRKFNNMKENSKEFVPVRLYFNHTFSLRRKLSK